MKPDRNPDGFDHFRRRHVAETLAETARGAMPASQARLFSRFLAALERGERPVDPPEPPRVRKRPRKPPDPQGKLL